MKGPEMVRVEVATVPRVEGVPLPVQSARLPTVGVEEVAICAERVTEEPRATSPPPWRPEPAVMVREEFVRPVLSRVPETVGVKSRREVEGTMVVPKVSPLKAAVVVAKVMVVPVVEAQPDPRAVMPAALPHSLPVPETTPFIVCRHWVPETPEMMRLVVEAVVAESMVVEA